MTSKKKIFNKKLFKKADKYEKDDKYLKALKNNPDAQKWLDEHEEELLADSSEWSVRESLQPSSFAEGYKDDCDRTNSPSETYKDFKSSTPYTKSETVLVDTWEDMIKIIPRRTIQKYNKLFKENKITQDELKAHVRRLAVIARKDTNDERRTNNDNNKPKEPSGDAS